MITPTVAIVKTDHSAICVTCIDDLHEPDKFMTIEMSLYLN